MTNTDKKLNEIKDRAMTWLIVSLETLLNKAKT
jgi:hypothetical protein